MTGPQVPERPDLRPAGAYLHGPGVSVPARVCAWLLNHTQLANIRAAVRGDDPQVDAVLQAIAASGQLWQSGSATSSATALGGQPQPAPALEVMSTRQAADRLDISEQAIRKAITEERLPASKVKGRWQLTTHDLADYAARRAA